MLKKVHEIYENVEKDLMRAQEAAFKHWYNKEVRLSVPVIGQHLRINWKVTSKTIEIVDDC